LRSRTARERQKDQGRRLRSAVARKTESEADLFHAGKAVPQLLRDRGPLQRRDRREAARTTRAASRQRRVPPRLRHFPPPGAAIGAPRPRAGEWEESQ